MSRRRKSERRRVLHVLTLGGEDGVYGGPVRVAKETCGELGRRGWDPHIFSGILAPSSSSSRKSSSQTLVIVKPKVRSLPFSSLWNYKIPFLLWREIRQSDIVHIHFARELIPLAAAFLCIIARKPFVTQTHGMVIFDNRRSILVVDRVLTRVVLNHSSTNFVLTQHEWDAMKPLNLSCKFRLVPNGILVPDDFQNGSKRSRNKIVFCSRIQSRKRPDRFLDLASYSSANFPELKFELYGPDGGELGNVIDRINMEEELSNTEYLGVLHPEEVTGILAQAHLLILPSENEPWAMIGLEALSVGTPILVMPSCGISFVVKEKFPQFVARTDDYPGLLHAFIKFQSQPFASESPTSIQSFCRSKFSISNVALEIEAAYLEVIPGE